MNVLNEGGGAVDAVEVAIRILEDKEITNAGFGSNLSMDGTVECDATIVDHYGRSGAVGAVGRKLNLSARRKLAANLLAAEVQHPIHLARLILDYSTKPLSLRRVPPNLLAGLGATAFAASLQVPVVPPNRLVSNAAHERWIKWARDLKIAESRIAEYRQESEKPQFQTRPQENEQLGGPSHSSSSTANEGLLHAPGELTAGTPPTSLSRTATSQSMFNCQSAAVTKQLTCAAVDHTATPPIKRLGMDAASTPTPSHIKWAGQRSGNDGEPGRTLGEDYGELFVDENPPMTRPIPSITNMPQVPTTDYTSIGREGNFTLAAIPTPVLENTDLLRQETPLQPLTSTNMGEDEAGTKSVSLIDDITDTVGAIAVDCLGNIAAGSSSGGIGMKHKGRIGPAALVGIGTAVVPVDPDDADRTSVATVTSGTGEHMATTMAATACANRLYTGTRKSRGGGSESTDDDAAVKGFIEQDFMGNAQRRS